MSEKEKIFDHQHHQGREDLAGENRFGDLGHLILLFIFLGIWILDSFFLKFSIVQMDSRWLYLRIPLGIGILLLSLWLARSGLNIVFGEVREQPHAIRKGVFGIVRHPIYLGAILFYLGLLVLSLSLTAVAVWVVIIGFYMYLCRYEEQLLTKKFGDEYLAYMKKVPMLLPRLVK